MISPSLSQIIRRQDEMEDLFRRVTVSSFQKSIHWFQMEETFRNIRNDVKSFSRKVVAGLR